MILPLNSANISFSADKKDEKALEYSHDTLLKNNLLNNTLIGVDKFTNAFTVYPAKGMKGSKNANFYEFLTMGTVPYLVGSGMMMAVFNLANKHYSPFQTSEAAKIGNKLALGVLFYGIMKSISKLFVSLPIRAFTGIDTEKPYAKVIYELPDDINDTDITSIEHHKVFESVEFPRWDLLYGDEKKGEKRNVYYDKIAKRLGMGANLNDSDQEVKPRIKEIVVKANLAKNISSYMWAACGVALAFQKPWEDFFNVMTFKFWKGKEFKKTIESFGKSFVNSAKNMWYGEGKGIQKHAGKILVGTALLTSVLGVLNSLHSSKSNSINSNLIDKNSKYVVN